MIHRDGSRASVKPNGGMQYGRAKPDVWQGSRWTAMSVGGKEDTRELRPWRGAERQRADLFDDFVAVIGVLLPLSPVVTLIIAKTVAITLTNGINIETAAKRYRISHRAPTRHTALRKLRNSCAASAVDKTNHNE